MNIAAATLAQVILKPRKAAPFWGHHPWVLDSAIARVPGALDDGDVVDLVADTGRWIARGIYNSRSRIRVRLYSWEPDVALDETLWRRRLSAAVALRRAIGYDDPAGAARLVYSEADVLSGLVVDRYADHLVVQPTSLSMAARLDVLIPLLVEIVRPQSITVRTDAAMAKSEGLSLLTPLPPRERPGEGQRECTPLPPRERPGEGQGEHDDAPSPGPSLTGRGVIWNGPRVIWDGPRYGTPPTEPVTIVEHGLKFSLPWGEGQKTGFYLDQRENRRAVAGYCAGRRVLDVCCYTGGFGLAAAALGGAREVLGIDTSARAVDQARANAALNGIENVRFETGDCFERLQQLVDAGERFGAVILDPPRFARRRVGIDEALRAYHRLNRLAVELLEPGGVLATCSCSGNVAREDFFSMLFGVALKTHREIQILEQRGAAADHPVSVSCPENEYLKCFICRVW